MLRKWTPSRRPSLICAFGCGLLIIACSSSDGDPESTPAIAGDGERPGPDYKDDGRGSGEAEAAADGSAAPGSGSGFATGSGAGGSGGASAAAGAGGSGALPLPTDPDPGRPGSAGVLTAGAWDDNRNFDWFVNYRATLSQAQLPGLLPISEDEHRAAYSLFSGATPARQKLDVSLVIDTTGSMGDEIRYLQSEFVTLSNAILQKYPDAEQRWSLVLYKDTTDEYIVRWFDFRSDPQEFQFQLSRQSAGGGGDFPEAPDDGLSTAADLSWRSSDATAKLAFWVADAPHHDENAEAMANAIRELGQKDVHVYPIASSGVDELTELTMRSAAQLTGGRYLFLTDDSGVGGAHKEPTIPCYYVTRLDDAILRMVDIELTGAYREPTKSEIIRTGGNPQAGECTLQAGGKLSAF
jgi:hypothetical protein